MLPIDPSSLGGAWAKLGVSNVFGGGKKAAKKARRAQWMASQKALKFQKAQYEQLKGLQQPFMEGGQSFGLQAALSGLQGPEAQAAAYNQFQQAQVPAVDFGANVPMAGMPAGLEGALRSYSQGVAGQDFDNYYNRLGVGAGMGQGAVSALGGMAVDQGAGIANTMIGTGEGLANAYLARGQMQAQNLSNLMSLGGAAASAAGSMYKPMPTQQQGGSYLGNMESMYNNIASYNPRMNYGG